MTRVACRQGNFPARAGFTDCSGFTGLEAAIVLIAFIVVAAVFSYIMLGTGFFATEKGKETVHASVAQASSSILISGDVHGKAETATNLANIFYTVALAPGGTPVDFD